MKKKLPILSAYALFIFAVLLVLTSGCDTKAKKAAEYNDRIVAQQVHIIEALNALDSSLNAIEIDMARQDLGALRERLKSGMRSLDSLGDFEGDEDFIDATRELFRHYDEVADNYYPELIGLLALPDTSFTPEIQKRAFAVEEELINHIRTAHERFKEEQKNFGKRCRLRFN